MGLCLRSTTATIVCAIEEFTTVMAIRTYYVAISKQAQLLPQKNYPVNWDIDLVAKVRLTNVKEGVADTGHLPLLVIDAFAK